MAPQALLDFPALLDCIYVAAESLSVLFQSRSVIFKSSVSIVLKAHALILLLGR